MASELQLQAAVSYTKNGASVQRNISGTVSVAGTALVNGVQNIGTTDETLALGDVATNGALFVHNLDGTNYVTLGADGSSYPIKLLAGEFGLLRWNGAAIHAKANTAACDLEYILFSN